MPVVEFRTEGAVAIMTLNRPEAKNAMNAALMKDLGDGFRRISEDDSIRVAVLTGAGQTFCSGMDLKAFAAGEQIDATGIPYGGRDYAKFSKPLIAAIEGYAIAGGFELAMICDMIVASSAAKFGLPEVKRGLVPGAGGLTTLARYAPPRIASEMVLTGDLYPAEVLMAHGVINRMTEPGAALDEAIKLANVIAANGPLAIKVAKEVLAIAPDWPVSESWDNQRPLIAPVFASEDAREGAMAFAEKRAPQWKGR